MTTNAIPVYGTPQGYGGPILYANEVAKTANYTITRAETGTRFTNTGATGAVQFTLPALSPNLVYGFLVIADQSVTVVSAAGTDIVWANNAGKSSLAFSTSSEKIGGALRFTSNQAGTKWYVENESAGANASGGNTITAA